MKKTVPKPEKVDVLICGGGPVGLYLACLLAETEVTFLVLESRSEPVRHTRSIGIHPPSIDLFGRIGLAEQLISRGVRISRGVAHSDMGKLGELDFGILPGPHRYVLAVPQYETEGLLEARLMRRRPDALRRGVQLTGFQTDGNVVVARASQVAASESVSIQGSGSGSGSMQGSGMGSNPVTDLDWGSVPGPVSGTGFDPDSGLHAANELVFEAKYLVGCDGKGSMVRSGAGISFHGGPYADTYIMGDFPEHSADRYTAGIWLHSDGLVESFPLPGGLRRWVAKTDDFTKNAIAENLCILIEQRTGVRLKPESQTMVSAFGVQRYLAATMRSGNILLAGDSAHVVSPIGGQGMNLGWLDVADLSRVLPGVIRGVMHPSVLDVYSRKRLKAAETAIRRAEFNMAMGRRTRLPGLRSLFARTLLRRPFNKLMAGLFTMRWL